MRKTVQIIGSYLSPYVRKVLVVLAEKGIPYQIDPLVPFFGDDRFTRLSPLRRVPVLIDEGVTLCDSSVICQYLEDRYPQPSVYPEDIGDRAQARWLEEFADTRMGDVFIWRLFNQVAIRPAVFGEKPDATVLERTHKEELPSILDYLESQLPDSGYLFGSVSIADISVATFFRNAAFARYQLDASRWSKTAAFVDRVLTRPSFAALVPFEQLCLRTPPNRHREVLATASAPLWGESFSAPSPRRGIM